MPARLVDHTHKVGYDQCIVGRRCCFVQCDECGDAGIALNSGHHYGDEYRPHAERLAAEHNAAHHPLSPVGLLAERISEVE